MIEPEATAAAARFGGAVASLEALDDGHINATFAASTTRGEIVVQRVNTSVIVDPAAVAHNAVLLRGRVGGMVPEPLADPDGAFLWHARGTWRAWSREPGTTRPVPTVATARSAARLVGRFHRGVAAMDPATLGRPLPPLHDPTRHLARLRAVMGSDPLGRAARVRNDVEVIEGYGWLADRAADLMAAVPTRVAHHDAKLTNVLFTGDDATRIVDLDTVMAGQWFWDVGDLVRSAASTDAEDEPGPGTGVRPELVRAVLDGYLDGAGEVLTETERDAVNTAGAVVTFEQAVRFLADWVDGDRYYRTSRPDQNLDRARAQLRLLTGLLTLHPDPGGR